MKKMFLLFVILMISELTFAQGAQNQSGFTERERLQQQIDTNRREVERAGEANRPNAKSTPYKVDISNIDPNAQFTIDHKSLVYQLIREGDINMVGGKLTSAVSMGFYKEANGSKWRLTAGFELPGDYVAKNLIYYVGGGFQLGRKGDSTGFYFVGGLDHRILSWLKLQYGLNWVVGANLGLTIGTGVTF